MGRHAQHRSRSVPVTANPGAEFFARLREQLGPEVDGLAEALATPPPISIRVNSAKWTAPAGLSNIPWSANGYYLDERPSFTFDPLLHGGCYYVQEASSMLLEQAVLATGVTDERIVALDLCAAPGGKSTHLRSLLHRDALVVSNEIDRKRQHVLVENLWKWGAGNTVITGAAPEKLQGLPAFFDLVLVDAPCSGEGMFRKDPFARAQWSTDLVAQCSQMQRDALEHAWNSLRPGGHLIYSTCTWEISENEAQVARLVGLGGNCVSIAADPAWGVLRSDREGVDALRCYPHRMCGEGFFIAVVRKGGDRPERPKEPVSRQFEEAPELNWLSPRCDWHAVEHNDVLHAVESGWISTVKRIQMSLPVLSPGIPLAEKKADAWRPHAALALATDLDPSPFTHVPVDLASAVAYLQGQALPAQDAEGAGLVTYQAVPLGWVQGAGRRWNNRWQAPWRIRTQQPGAPRVSWSR
ncbi:MAG TPA: hypothetical protein PLR96_00165 [Flavobacteriales bacterium]|nr:hypothetical protein [Flavobacteriales bacterium]